MIVSDEVNKLNDANLSKMMPYGRCTVLETIHTQWTY